MSSMRIALVGDTHRDIQPAERALRKLGPFDYILHTGDFLDDAALLGQRLDQPVIAVAGNCDGLSLVARERVLELGGIRILLSHGHLYEVKRGLLPLFYRAREVGADLVVYGHTHIAACETESGIVLVNPGSVTLPRDGRKTMAVAEVEPGRLAIRLLVIDELGMVREERSFERSNEA